MSTAGVQPFAQPEIPSATFEADHYHCGLCRRVERGERHERSGIADDEQAVRKVLRDFHATLSARDLKAFGQLFAEDAEFVNHSA